MNYILALTIFLCFVLVFDASYFKITVFNEIKLLILFTFYCLLLLTFNCINIKLMLIYIGLFILILLAVYITLKIKFLSLKGKNVLFVNINNTKLYCDDIFKFAARNFIKISNVKIINSLKSNIVNDYDIVIISANHYKETLEKILKIAEHAEVYIMINYELVPFVKNNFVKIKDIPFIRIKKFQLSRLNMLIKRIFDIVFSIFILILFFPIILITAVLIKIDSPGKVFYIQDRETINNKVFKIYKFRSMYNENKDNDFTLTKPNDNRVTRIGKIIRKFKIDEIPQFVNVIKGEMSVVGPRPERPYYIEKYMDNIKYYYLRFNIKAGITGLSHIYGNYYTLPEYRYIYDLIYISSYSLLLDIKIIVKTFFVMINLD